MPPPPAVAVHGLEIPTSFVIPFIGRGRGSMNVRSRPLRSALIGSCAAGAGLLFLAFGAMCVVIGGVVDSALERAHENYSGDDTDALIAMMNAGDIPLKDRNRAVWALGQLGDRRAAAAIEKLLTGGPCDHTAAVCQRELKKALRQCRGGINITRWAWRPFVL
jgi:hypothetical protein